MTNLTCNLGFVAKVNLSHELSMRDDPDAGVYRGSIEQRHDMCSGYVEPIVSDTAMRLIQQTMTLGLNPPRLVCLRPDKCMDVGSATQPTLRTSEVLIGIDGGAQLNRTIAERPNNVDSRTSY